MSISVNGQSVVPPGFRFHPTEEELLTYYLKKKVASEHIDLDVIRDVDLNKLEPWDIQERCRIGTGPQNDWYFFSHKDKKYPTGTRTNRATAAGFWKATGRDKAIYTSFKRIGMRKTLVFYEGRAPHGKKSDWIMHEYRLDDIHPHPAAPAAELSYYSGVSSPMRGVAGDQSAQEEGWVICRVFKKKNLVHQGQSSGGATAASHTNTASKLAAAMESSSSNCSTVTVSDHVKAQMLLQHSASDDALDHILQYMGRSCKQETKPAATAAAPNHLIANYTTACANTAVYGRFMKLPPLEHVVAGGGLAPPHPAEYTAIADDDWDTLDRLAAYELNGLATDASTKNSMAFFDDHTAFSSIHPPSAVDGASDGDLWSLARSVSSLHADLTMNN